MYDIINCEAKKNHGFTKLIHFSRIKNKIIRIKEDKDILKNINFRGIFLLENFRIGHEMIKVIGKKRKAIFLVDLSRLYKSKGVRKGIILSQLRDFFKFCIKYNAKYSLASFAEKEEEIRDSFEVIGVGSLVGLNEGQVIFALKEIEGFVK